jgi:hypothetical protein
MAHGTVLKPEDVARFTSASLKTPLLSLDGQAMYARLVDVHDGDTITVVIDFHGELRRMRVRFEGLNAPELFDSPRIPSSKGINSRNFVIEFLIEPFNVPNLNRYKTLNKTWTSSSIRQMLEDNIIFVFLECRHFEKYGRTLARVFRTRTSAPIQTSEDSRTIPTEQLSCHVNLTSTECVCDQLLSSCHAVPYM